MRSHSIYLDYAATTPTDELSLSAALPYFGSCFFNPSSAHSAGQSARAAAENARLRCARAVNASPSEIIFTSSGTEAVNQAIFSAPEGKKRIVVSSIEHESVISAAERMREKGFEIIYVKPDSDGIITAEALSRAVDGDTGLVCVMAVNNITGAVQPIKELAKTAHESGALFFTDAVQAVNGVDIDVKKWNVDMLAVSAHKFYGMKGAGFLYAKGRKILRPLIVGGEQESGLRAGTINVPAVVSMGVAAERAQSETAEYNAQAGAVAARFLAALDCGTPVMPREKTPDILSVIFDGINGGRLAVALSLAGVCCSVGSACSAGSATAPRALTEMGINNADCSVRFSFGRGLTAADAQKAAETVNSVVRKL